MAEIENPHDMYFKRTMGDIDIVRILDLFFMIFPFSAVRKLRAILNYDCFWKWFSMPVQINYLKNWKSVYY
ncbi:MAG: hypothetical protein ACOCQA_02250 [bacterium]